MNRRLGILGTLGLAALALATVGSTYGRAPAPEPDLAGAGTEAWAANGELADGEVCTTGCQSLEPTELPKEEYLELLSRFAVEKELDGIAFETLLFHGDATRSLVVELGTPGLDEARTARLKSELARREARLSVRLVRADGTERLVLDSALVPLGIKQHLWPREVVDLRPPEVSGTVQRVGVKHLWARL